MYQYVRLDARSIGQVALQILEVLDVFIHLIVDDRGDIF